MPKVARKSAPNTKRPAKKPTAKPSRARVSEKFDRATQRYTADGTMTSNEAKNLRGIAYDDAHHDTGFDPKNAVAYSEVFDRLAGQRTDKGSTAAYLRNAASEFRYLDADRRSGPALEKAFRKAAAKDRELAEILQRDTKFDSDSVFGSPNAAVQHYVRLDDIKFTHGWEYYAEKIARMVKTDPSMAEFRDVVNTVVFQGYGAYRIPDPLVSGDLDVPRMNGRLTVPGTQGDMAEVLAKVSRQGRVLMSDASRVYGAVTYRIAESFDSEASARAFLAGVDALLPFADHRQTRGVLQRAKSEAEIAVRVHAARPTLDALVAAHRREAPFTDLVARNPVSLGTRRIVLSVKRETPDPQVLQTRVQALLAADPTWAGRAVDVSVERQYN